MLRTISVITLLISFGIGGWAQDLTLMVKVVSDRKALVNAEVEQYQYFDQSGAVPTNELGISHLNIEPGIETLINVYKAGYQSSSLSLQLNEAPANPIVIELFEDKDATNFKFNRPKERLVLVNQVLERLPYNERSFSNPERIDTIKVLLDRAMVASEHRYASFRLKQNVHANKSINELQTEIARLSGEIIKKEQLYNQLELEEQKWKDEAKTKKGNAQLKRLVNAQKAQYQRVDAYLNKLYAKQLRFNTFQAIYLSRAAENSAKGIDDPFNRDETRALNAGLHIAHLANRIEHYAKLKTDAYQEYLELLQYLKEYEAEPIIPDPPADILTSNTDKPKSVIAETDSLLQMEDSEREALINLALQEEKRFANFEEFETIEQIGRQEVEVLNTKIADDHYKRAIDSKGKFRYYKNDKPITLRTYTLETKRKYKEFLEELRNL